MCGKLNTWIKRLPYLFVGLIILGLIFYFAIASLIIVRTEYSWICATCGAKKHMTEYMFGSEKSSKEDDGYYAQLDEPDLKIEMSPLTEWMFQNGITHQHKWVKIKGTGYDIMGIPRSFSHDSAPPIYNIKPMQEKILKYVVENYDADRIKKLIEILESSDREAATKECQKIQDEYFARGISAEVQKAE